MILKRVIVYLFATTVIMSGCGSGSSVIAVGESGGGASSPTTPAQIPTSVEYGSMEYSGGEVSGAISVQMGKSLQFVVKDTDGNIISDPNVTIELLQVSDVSASESALKSAGGPLTDTVVTDRSCGTTAISGENITYTGPSNWAGNLTSQCKIRASYESEALTGEFEMKISLSPELAETNLSFTTSQIFSNAESPDLAIDSSGRLYACYSDETTKDVYFSKSVDRGATWSTPVLIDFNTDYYVGFVCGIDVSDDGDIVVVAGRYVNITGGNVLTQVERFVYSSDSGATFGTSVDVFGAAALTMSYTSFGPKFVIDSNGIVHYIVYFATGYATEAYLTACTSTACDDVNTLSYAAGYDEPSIPSIAISSNNKIYPTWGDSDKIYLIQVTYDGSTYSASTAAQISGSCTATNPAIVVDRNNKPSVSYACTTGYTDSDIYIATYDPSTGSVTTPVKVSDVASTELPMISRPYVTYDNYIHVMYFSYGAGYANPRSWHTMQDGNGSYVASKNVEISGFKLGQTTVNLQTDPVGRPYIIWDALTYDGDTYIRTDVDLATPSIE